MAGSAMRREEMTIAEGSAAKAWLVVVTKANCERIARDQLTAQGFEAYLPLRLLGLEAARRRGISSAPFFPRILFARATLDAYRWQAIFSTYGVQRVLCDPMSPRGVRPDFVRRLRQRELDGFLQAGLEDPLHPRTAPLEKDHRTWQKLGDVLDGLCAETIDSNRAALLLTLVRDGRAAVTQGFRK